MKAPLPLQAAGGHENLPRLHAPVECGARLPAALLLRHQELDLRAQWPQAARRVGPAPVNQHLSEITQTLEESIQG